MAPGEKRIGATEEALALLARLRERHGPLMLFISGGCCEGSSPMCLHDGELLIAPGDERLGELDGTACWIDAEQYERWNRPHLVIDVARGGSDTLSLEGPEGVHFVTRTPVAGR